MDVMSVAEAAERWNVSERTVRNYCANGRIVGAFMRGKTWHIPADAERPEIQGKTTPSARGLYEVLKEEMGSRTSGGIYHKIQIDLTYNSNRIEGSQLSQEQTRLIFETNTIGFEKQGINVDDVVETANHFRCIDMIISQANYPVSETMIKRLHFTLKSGTSDSRKPWFAVGEYKKLPNEVGGRETTSPEDVALEIQHLLAGYNDSKEKSFDALLDFHYRFERIHSFQDGNGRVGRLILFKECLKTGIVPFIINDEHKLFYYCGLSAWEQEKGFLRDTCLSAQDTMKAHLDYFRIPYTDNP